MVLSGSAAFLKQTKPFCPCGCRYHLQELLCSASLDYTGSAERDARGQGWVAAPEPQKGKAVNSSHSCRVFPRVAVHLCTFGVSFSHISPRCGAWKATALLIPSLFGCFFHTKHVQGQGIGCDFLLFSQIQNFSYRHIISGQRKELYINFCQKFLWNSHPLLQMKCRLLRLL